MNLKFPINPFTFFSFGKLMSCFKNCSHVHPVPLPDLKCFGPVICFDQLTSLQAPSAGVHAAHACIVLFAWTDTT